MKKIFFILILLVLITGILIGFNQAQAFKFTDVTSFYGQTASKTGLTQTDPAILVAIVIQQVLTIVGALLIILLIYGGITWMTAGGNEERVGKAKKTILYSVIGVIVIIGSYSITFFISTTIESAQQEGETELTDLTGATCADLGGVCETIYSCAQMDGNVLGTCVGGDNDGQFCTHAAECPGGSCNNYGCGSQICCQVPGGAPTAAGNCQSCGEGALNICDVAECSQIGSNCVFYNGKCYERGDCTQCSGIRCDDALCVALGCTWYGSEPPEGKKKCDR